MDKSNIAREARHLLGRLWKDRESLWPLGVPHPIDMLEPSIAAKVLGVSFSDNQALSSFGARGTKFEIGGLIDRQAKRIAVSGRFPYLTRRFTAAHEIAHWILHTDEVMHRDLPLDGASKIRRAPKEAEADHFAACFLMPPKLVREQFEARFGPTPFAFTDDTAFFLDPRNPRHLLHTGADCLDRALVLAAAESYGRAHFYSIAQQFRVSNLSMAVRLMELGLIRFP